MSPLRRRAISITAVVGALVVMTASAPLLLIVALAVDLVTAPHRFAHLRLLAMSYLALAIDLAGTIAAGVLWIAAGGGRLTHTAPLQRAHFALQHWWAGALLSAAGVTVGLRISVEHPELAEHGNVIVLGRHTSIGDALIPAGLLGHRYRLDVRYVLKDDLQWDPCIDIVGHRLGHYFVDRGGDGDAEAKAIRAMAATVRPRSAAVIFPEGTFFNVARQQRAVKRLAAGSRPELAVRAAALRHLLPPRPAGTLALLDGAPGADVLILGHIGFEAFTSLGAIRRAVPFREPVRVWLRQVPRADIPRGDDARVDWLYAQWEQLDEAIGARSV